jgi:hypothetical protein
MFQFRAGVAHGQGNRDGGGKYSKAPFHIQYPVIVVDRLRGRTGGKIMVVTPNDMTTRFSPGLGNWFRLLAGQQCPGLSMRFHAYKLRFFTGGGSAWLLACLEFLAVAVAVACLESRFGYGWRHNPSKVRDMRNRKAIFALLALVAGGLAIFMVTRASREERDAVAVVFTGQESAGGRLIAHFCLTNGGTRAVWTQSCKVQTFSDNQWRTANPGELLLSTVGQGPLPIAVEAGKSISFFVASPGNLPWRVSVYHGLEQGGWSVWRRKAREAWARGTLANWRTSFRSFGDFREATSEEIAR